MNNRFSSPFVQILLFGGCVIASTLLVTFLGAAIAPCFGFSFSDVVQSNTGQSLALTRYILLLQSVGIFLLPAYFAMRFLHKNALSRLGFVPVTHAVNILNVIAMAVVALPCISFMAEINAQLPLPQWAIDLEETAIKLTEQLLFTENTGEFLLNLLVIAALPALAEEVFFRGLLQRWLHDRIKNAHWAIFVTALIFSTVHLQFAGFLPRVLLGVAFGYLFYWSKSLWLSITAHFVNNATAVCIYFYASYNHLPVDTEAIDAATQGSTFLPLLSALVTGLFLWRIFQIESGKL